ncbi:hypothetical protein PEC302107_40140 [Pectobacterium araliae]|uniref:Uncharacterized protein n=1 Tax=Pectobacterium araliae TaxID=3073862 RepID=A0AAN0KAI6_9GAMM|nr:hypothetical protein PEC302110_06120 [Pectobacterium sp. MAFF 302110]GKW22285.1 hypothetical protein PEC302107_40140 [Pectobacterium carotovorum subsp. carotovorum]
MNMTFQSFLINGRTSFVFGEFYETVLGGLKNSKSFELDRRSGSFAIYYMGIEFLFDNYKLCLVQYEISRVLQLYVNKNKITGSTSIDDFKGYLDEIDIRYLEEEKDGQIILITNQGVKIYFEENLFSTAMKSW